MSEFLWISIGRICVGLLTLANVKITTSYFSPSQYGQLALLISIQFFCSLVLVSPIGQYINRHTHEWQSSGILRQKLDQHSNYLLATALIGMAICCIFSFLRSGVSPDWFELLAIFLAVYWVNLNATYVPLLNMLGFAKKSAQLSLLGSALVVLFCFFSLKYIDSVPSWLIAYSSALLVPAFIARSYIRKYVVTDPDFERSDFLNWATYRDFCIPLAISAGLLWFLQYGHRWIIEYHWGASFLGLLALGMTLAMQIFGLVESVLMQYFYPRFFKKLDEFAAEDRSQEIAMSQIVNLLGPIYLLLAGILLTLAYPIVFLLGGSSYIDAYFFFAVGILIELCRSVANVFSLAAQIRKVTATQVPPYLCAIVLFFITSVLLYVISLPAKFIAFSLLVAGIGMVVMMYYLMYNLVNFTIQVGYWLLGFLALSAGISINLLFSWSENLAFLVLESFLISLPFLIVTYYIIFTNANLNQMLKCSLNNEKKE
ncbi:lipopolysaccharide biosynthesis protein [Parvibium lacunae]|uniref:Lipopolysaccharide biosynthesis protein n=1 Tax=Parvibium lacunae TaxID=1888893 RepID=A0A368L1I1_9BURK|nr:oligosaccharide flippase family protein [Parvibium lacunae]RCS57404.1 hypothetical protein DU000_08045 [Parvibium lacunae]